MNSIIAYCLLILGAYLLGSLPYMMLLARVRGFDFSREVDLHISMMRKVGFLEGVTGILVDVLKGVIPLLIGFYLGFPPAIVASAGISALVGQMWPVFNRFDGEKGNTIGWGIAITVSPLYHAVPGLLIGIAIVFVGFAVRTIPHFFKPGQTMKERVKFDGPPSNSLPLAMLIAFAAMPLLSWLFDKPLHLTVTLAVMFLLIVVRRLTARILADIRTARTSVKRILLMRFLLDRSYY
jgi:glycerol-3-phosphate acyltransferase PlsY